MSSALFVVSEHGYWGEECITPLDQLTEAGVDITVATPSGEKPTIDEQSIDPGEVGEETAKRCRGVHDSDERLADPEPVAAVDPTEFDGAVFPGGHGTVWDINQDRQARNVLRTMVEGESGVALVVCHAVGILAFTRDSDGGFLVEGRDVTGFPDDWEEDIVDEFDRMPDGRKLPYWVEQEVQAAGGEWDAELDQETSVIVDGDLITARGPPSSEKAAETLLEQL